MKYDNRDMLLIICPNCKNDYLMYYENFRDYYMEVYCHTCDYKVENYEL